MYLPLRMRSRWYDFEFALFFECFVCVHLILCDGNVPKVQVNLIVLLVWGAYATFDATLNFPVYYALLIPLAMITLKFITCRCTNAYLSHIDCAADARLSRKDYLRFTMAAAVASSVPSSSSSAVASVFSNNSSIDRDASAMSTPQHGFHTSPHSPYLPSSSSSSSSASSSTFASAAAASSASSHPQTRIEFNRDQAKRDGFSFSGIRP